MRNFIIYSKYASYLLIYSWKKIINFMWLKSLKNKHKYDINKDKTKNYATLFKFKSKAISCMNEVDIF